MRSLKKKNSVVTHINIPSTHLLSSALRVLLFGCWIKANSPNMRLGPRAGVPSVGVILRYPTPYLL